MTNTIQHINDASGDRYVFGNDDGTWVVWAQPKTFADGRVVGPGYVGRMTMRADGERLTEGIIQPTLSMNDPLWQGIGGVGWHHFRQNGETDIWNKGWELLAHRWANPADPFGPNASRVVVEPYVTAGGELRGSFEVDYVDRYSAAEGKRVAVVRYDYIFDSSQMKQWVTIKTFPDGADSGPACFVKEPKVVVGISPRDIGAGYVPDAYRYVDLYPASGAAAYIDFDLNSIGDPSVNTKQIGWDTRCRLRFRDAEDTHYVNFVARASTDLAYGADNKPTNYGTRSDWEGATSGMDKWAQNANPRAEFASTPCAAYCKQGPGSTLTRQWEIAKRPSYPEISLMLHAWEGGSGLPDCLCCAKTFTPGETYTTYLSVSRDAGWQI